MKKRFLLIIVVFLVFTFSNFISVRATTVEEKVYSTATIDDEFSAERVIVILNENASQVFKEYRTSDFSEIKCKGIKVLNSTIREKSKKQLQGKIIPNESKNKTILSVDLKEKSKQNVLNTIEKLKDRDDIYYVGPDYKIQALSTIPDDYYYNISSYLSEYQWAINNISLPNAWDLTTGSSEVIVGVLDSGIDGTHPDLDDNINTTLCRDFTSGSEVVVNNPIDLYGHGTKVAGVIGAETNNEIGIAGVCWNIQLASLKVLDDNGVGYGSNVALAIDFAEKNNIPIINMSIGWYGSNPKYSTLVETMIEDYSGLVVCAAGNDGYNNDNYNHYPSNLTRTFNNVISVGASNRDDERWISYENASNYGFDTVDLFAPGFAITSTSLLTSSNIRYDTDNGTSMATPFVTGVAALILSLHPNLTSAQIKNIILTSVDIIPSLADYCVTGGRLNAEKAVKNALLHTYTYSYTSTNMEYHTCTCTCGYTFTENHEWYLISPSATLLRYACRYCSAVTTLPPVVENKIIKEEDKK